MRRLMQRASKVVISSGPGIERWQPASGRRGAALDARSQAKPEKIFFFEKKTQKTLATLDSFCGSRPLRVQCFGLRSPLWGAARQNQWKVSFAQKKGKNLPVSPAHPHLASHARMRTGQNSSCFFSSEKENPFCTVWLSFAPVENRPTACAPRVGSWGENPAAEYASMRRSIGHKRIAQRNKQRILARANGGPLIAVDACCAGNRAARRVDYVESII